MKNMQQLIIENLLLNCDNNRGEQFKFHSLIDWLTDSIVKFNKVLVESGKFL